MFNKITIFFLLSIAFYIPVMGMETDDDDCYGSLEFRRKPKKENKPFLVRIFEPLFCCTPGYSISNSEQNVDTVKAKKASAVIVPIAVPIEVSVVPIQILGNTGNGEEELKNNLSSDSNQSESISYRPRNFSYTLTPASQIDLFAQSECSQDDEFLDYDFDNNNYLTQTVNELLKGELRECNVGKCGKFYFESQQPIFEVSGNIEWFAQIMQEQIIGFQAEVFLDDNDIIFDVAVNRREYFVNFNAARTYKIFLVKVRLPPFISYS